MLHFKVEPRSCSHEPGSVCGAAVARRLAGNANHGGIIPHAMWTKSVLRKLFFVSRTRSGSMSRKTEVCGSPIGQPAQRERTIKWVRVTARKPVSGDPS